MDLLILSDFETSLPFLLLALSAGAAEYTDWISAEE